MGNPTRRHHHHAYGEVMSESNELNILLAFVNAYMQDRTTEARDDLFMYAARLNRNFSSDTSKLNRDQDKNN